MNTKTKGFTLIELLVVIAIIGLLSSIVLASLNGARGKGADAAIKSDLKNVQAQAEILYDNASPNSYVNLCADATVINILTHAAGAASITYTLALQGTAETNANVACHVGGTNNQSYAVGVVLKTDNTKAWCIDSTGNSKQISTFLAANATNC